MRPFQLIKEGGLPSDNYYSLAINFQPHNYKNRKKKKTVEKTALIVNKFAE